MKKPNADSTSKYETASTALKHIAQRIPLRILSVFALITLGMTSLLACGGSTTGTGGVTIEGKVFSDQSTPLSGVVVTVGGHNDQAVTDADGNFQLYADSQTSYTILLAQEETTASATLEDIPQGASTVQATIIFSGQDDASVTEIKVDSHNDEDQTESSSSGNDQSTTSTSSSSSGLEDGSHNGEPGHPTDNPNDGNIDDGGVVDSSSSSGFPSSPPPDDDGIQPPSSSSGNTNPPSTGGGGSEPSNITVSGQITSISSSSITVSGRTFEVNRDTEFVDSRGHETTRDHFSNGMNVKVHGEFDNGRWRTDKVTELSS